jgi:hypothetical protein
MDAVFVLIEFATLSTFFKFVYTRGVEEKKYETYFCYDEYFCDEDNKEDNEFDGRYPRMSWTSQISTTAPTTDTPRL